MNRYQSIIDRTPSTQVTPEAAVVGTYIQNDIIRHGIEAVLRTLPQVSTVHHCAHPQDVAPAVAAERYDVIIADPAQAADACGKPGRTRVLMLVDDAEAEAAVARAPNADGFLLTHELSAAQLSSALVQIGRGELVMPSSLARRLLVRQAAADSPQPTGRARLTERQLAALRLMAMGLSNKQIARRLLISEHGAKRLVTSIMLKLDAPNRTIAVLAAMRCGVIPAPGDEAN